MLTAALVIAGWVALYVVVRITLVQSTARLRQEFQKQIDALVRVEASEHNAPSPATPAEVPRTVAIAAAAAVLGARKVYVRPAKSQPIRAGGDPWAQQGRAGVWSAHDIAQRWR